ncbi:hypothetical protein EV127DRAFT_492552 [Xylaria flabelliformis]|nr:hypothetical protein EV127DRAFT_492552 [Xylaria flabelliformis]
MDSVVKAYTQMAKSATFLMGNKAPKEEFENMSQIIADGREAFNFLCHVASMASSRAVSVISQGSGGESVAPEGDEAQAQTERVETVMYMKDNLRPNIHIASHYYDFAAEDAIIVNCNTLTREDPLLSETFNFSESNVTGTSHIFN